MPSPAPPDDLSPREAEVLAAIGRRLTNAEIAAELFVSVRTVESHIAALRRKLGVDSRPKLIEAAGNRRRSPVPLPPTSLVGRASELGAVGRLLEERRWVTVVGPAGGGKTRLALEVAAAGTRTALVVALEHADGDEVASVVAQAIGLGADSTADLVAASGAALSTRPHLLVIDNADRVTEAVGPLIAALLALAPTTSVLATSRSPIGGAAETVFPLEPLPIGPDAEGAARLFVDRATSAAPTVTIDLADAEVAALVTRICTRLDGLPLAIEIAAARVRHLSLDELADRLDDGLGLLDRPGAPDDRHRTLDAALAWTWDLLDDDERRVLTQLAALPRTFDLELAEAVSTAPGAGRMVLRLLDRSLVAPSATVTDPRRFRLLDPVRVAVLDRADPATVQHARLAHAEHHARLVADLAVRVRTADRPDLVATARRLAPEADAAIAWSLAPADTTPGAAARAPDLAVRLARGLAVVVEHCGPALEDLEAIARVGRSAAAVEQATATDLLEMGVALCYGDLDLVDALAATALAGAEDDRSRLAAHHLAGYAAAYRHRTAEAIAHLDVAEQLAEAAGDDWQLGSARQARGIALRHVPDPAAALSTFERSMQAYADAGDAMHVNNVRYMMASTAAESGLRTDEAVGWADESIRYARRSGNAHELAHATLARAGLTTRGGAASDDPSDRPVDLLDATEVFRAVGDLRCLTRSYLLLARTGPADERIELLEQALDVASRARDRVNQATTLERLVDARWDQGDGPGAAAAFGALSAVLGEEEAGRRSPPPLLARLGEWRAAVAEGRARHRSPEG